MCQVKSCVIEELRISLVGTEAKDGSAFTALNCKSSTLKHNAGNTWTVDCTATYSDGAQWAGYGNWLPGQDRVTFDPEDQVRQASGG
jgi:hypothetical protein